MTKFFSKLMLATLGLTLTVGSWSDVLACPRGGSGYYNSYSQPRYNYNYRPVHVQPRPVQFAPQPQVQFAPQQQVQFAPQQQQLQIQQQQLQLQQQQPLQALGGQAAQVSGQQFQQAGGQPVQQAGGQQFAGQQAFAGQTGGQNVQQAQFASQGQQQGGVNTIQGGQQQSQAPQQSISPQQSSAPQQSNAPQQVGNAPAAQNNPAAQEQLSAQQSALQALMAFGEEEADASASSTPAPQGEESFHVGSWTAVLANNVTVQLILQADGAFRWTANANGKASAFEGTYSISGESMQLNRANDSQQLAGTIVRTNNGGFNFKLQGKTDNGLNFARN